MPSIFEKEGYRFFFYSNDHAPMHVHVEHGGGEAAFEFNNDGVVLRESAGMKISELRRAEELAIEHRKEIERRWHERFG